MPGRQGGAGEVEPQVPRSSSQPPHGKVSAKSHGGDMLSGLSRHRISRPTSLTPHAPCPLRNFRYRTPRPWDCPVPVTLKPGQQHQYRHNLEPALGSSPSSWLEIIGEKNVTTFPVTTFLFCTFSLIIQVPSNQFFLKEETRRWK